MVFLLEIIIPSYVIKLFRLFVLLNYKSKNENTIYIFLIILFDHEIKYYNILYIRGDRVNFEIIVDEVLSDAAIFHFNNNIMLIMLLIVSIMLICQINMEYRKNLDLRQSHISIYCALVFYRKTIFVIRIHRENDLNSKLSQLQNMRRWSCIL